MRMRWWSVLVLLAGCDRIFGIHDTHEIQIDAHFFDAGIDAPFACPSQGAPVFSPLLHQEFFQNCSEYSISADGTTAVALCYSASISVVHVGPPGKVLAPAAVPESVEGSYFAPRVSADGNELYITEYNYSTGNAVMRHFERSGSTWQTGTPVPFVLDPFRTLSHIARTPSGERVFVLDSMARTAQEWQRSGAGAWTTVGVPITAVDLAVPNFFRIALSADGLHALINAGGGADQPLFFTQRASPDSPFVPATPVEGLPHVDGYLTNDCARVYFADLGSIFYAQQQ